MKKKKIMGIIGMISGTTLPLISAISCSDNQITLNDELQKFNNIDSTMHRVEMSNLLSNKVEGDEVTADDLGITLPTIALEFLVTITIKFHYDNITGEVSVNVTINDIDGQSVSKVIVVKAIPYDFAKILDGISDAQSSHTMSELNTNIGQLQIGDSADQNDLGIPFSGVPVGAQKTVIIQTPYNNSTGVVIVTVTIAMDYEESATKDITIHAADAP